MKQKQNFVCFCSFVWLANPKKKNTQKFYSLKIQAHVLNVYSSICFLFHLVSSTFLVDTILHCFGNVSINHLFFQLNFFFFLKLVFRLTLKTHPPMYECMSLCALYLHFIHVYNDVEHWLRHWHSRQKRNIIAPLSECSRSD